MTKRLKRALPAVLAGLVVVIGTGGIQSGWTGTWVGDIENLTGSASIHLRLDIQEALGEIRIHARDSCGSECDLSEGDLECDENGLCFFYRIPGGSGWSEWIYISLERDGNHIDGTWENERGDRDRIRLRRIF